LDKIKLVAAAPEDLFQGDEFIGLEKIVRGSRKLRVASEYTNLTKKWMDKKGYTQENSLFVHSRGATEVFPPEDADIIVDNCQTGNTLKANRLRIIDDLLMSSTCLYAHKGILENSHNEEKKQAIEKFVLLLRSVLDAHQKVIVEFNVSGNKLTEIIKKVPAMRRPTVSPLHDDNDGEKWFAVKSAIHKDVLFSLIPLIKENGGFDIIVYDLKHVVI